MKDLHAEIVKAENKLLEKVFVDFLGRKPNYKDKGFIRIISTQSAPDYYYIMYGNKILGRVDKKVRENDHTFTTNGLQYLITFTPSNHNDKRTRYCQTSSR